MKPTVLVTDGEQRASLAVTRSLGRAGYRVFVCSAGGKSLAGASRYAAREWQVPDPLAAPDRFAAKVEELVRALGVALVIPITDAAALALLARRERLAPARIPFPDLDTFRAISDKARMMRLAPAVGIRVPEQRTLNGPAERAALEREPPRFPLVLKPARSVAGSGPSRTKHGVRHAGDAKELARCLDTLPAAAYPLLVQQRIVGPGIGIFLLLWDHREHAVFAHRRLREKPPSGGVSVYRESIAADPELVARSRRLLECCGWQGVAMVEYKLDAASGAAYLMEVNGRFWGSLQLALDAGVDFPALLAALALGQTPAPVTSYRLGVRSRWWWGDVDHLLARLRHSDAELALPPNAPGRGRAILDFLELWRPGDRNEILRLSDPMPFVRETIEWLNGR